MNERTEALSKAWSELCTSHSEVALQKANSVALRRAYASQAQLQSVIADLQSHLPAPIEALAEAAVVAAQPEPGGAAAGLGEGKAAAAGWEFPVFVGHRRRLAPDDELFEAGNIEREQLARQAAVSAARDERLQLSKEAELAGSADLAGRLATTFECAQCHASLPTARLLELHVSELHDSFFAAQVARRMPVYLCLVEGCPRKFCTVEERKQHLADHHKFPRNFHFDRIHLRRHRGQIRPLPQYRKGGHGRQAMAAEAAPADASAAAPGEPAAAAGQAAAAGGDAAASVPAAAAGAHEAAMADVGEDVVAGMSRLSMAAETSSVPNVVHFGRGRGRGLAGVPRGRGGLKVAPRGGPLHAAPPPKGADGSPRAQPKPA
ncbi:hypothetical protein ABPG75_010012 [Micractinium tetrahymenae]